MDESELERYFDKFIANDPRRTEDVSEHEQFVNILPDELLTLNIFTCDDAEPRVDVGGTAAFGTSSSGALVRASARIWKEEDLTAESGIAGTQPPNSSSQNSSAGTKLTCASSLSEWKTLLVNPGTPADPEILKEEPPKLVPVICNVISTVDLGCCLNLNIIARRMWNVEYKPKSFSGLFARIREPKATAIIFQTGKIICTGTTSVEESRLVARKFARRLHKFGFPVRFLNFKIQNIVATCKISPVNLEELQKVYRGHCSYEPEVFNGLILDRISSIRVSLFSTGSINVCGAKTLAEVYEVFETIYRILREHRERALEPLSTQQSFYFKAKLVLEADVNKKTDA